MSASCRPSSIVWGWSIIATNPLSPSRLTARASFLTQPPFSGAFVLMQLPFNVIERVSLPYHPVPRMVFTAERSETHTPSDCIDQTECACNRHHTEKSDQTQEGQAGERKYKWEQHETVHANVPLPVARPEGGERPSVQRPDAIRIAERGEKCNDLCSWINCAAAIVKPGPELVPEEVARKAGYKLGPSRADRSGRGTPEYGAIIFGTGDAVWQHDRADEKSSGPNGRPVSF